MLKRDEVYEVGALNEKIRFRERTAGEKKRTRSTFACHLYNESACSNANFFNHSENMFEPQGDSFLRSH